MPTMPNPSSWSSWAQWADPVAAAGLAGILDEAELEVLGLSVPEAAERNLQRATNAWTRPDEAEEHLRAAMRIAPEHPAVLIAGYRFLFYHGRLAEARDVCSLCLSLACHQMGRPMGWATVEPEDAIFSDWGAVIPRFLLFSLKGWAYLSMRLGEPDAARAALEKLLELDPSDRIGALTLVGVLERGESDEY